MSEDTVNRLEQFLRKRFAFQIPDNLIFKRLSEEQLQTWLKRESTRRSKIAQLSVNDFLTDEFMFDERIEKLVINTIIEKNYHQTFLTTNF